MREISEINYRLKMEESEFLELKKSTSELKEGIISIVSILNKHKKGKIIFGIKNNGEVIGQIITEKTLRDISKSISDHIEPKIFPKIIKKTITGKKCIVIDFEGNDNPYFAYGRAYMRVADEDKRLSAKKLENLIIKKNNSKLFWDESICSLATLQDISSKKLKKYLEKVGLKYSSKKDVLEKLSLMKNNKLTNASIIIFGSDVSKHFNLLNLRCAVFSGKDKSSEFIDMKDFNGDLFELIENAEKYILEHINIGMKLDGLRRINIPEINKDAFREAIINAFCHRDYNIPQEVQIAIFKDRVEILNPGKLYAGLKVKDILSRPISERRNSLIADMFHKVHLVEKWGTGIGKIRHLEPKTNFEEVSDFFLVTFKRKKILVEPLNEPLNEPLKIDLVLNSIKENCNCNRYDIVDKTKISLGSVKRYLKQLIKENKIMRVGSDKTGGYCVK